MVTVSITVATESPLEAKRLWNAMVKDGHNLDPKVAPEIISGVTIVQGDGGVGTIKQANFTPTNKEFSNVEGGVLGTKLASAKFELKFTPKAGGRCVSTWTRHYDTLPGVSDDQTKAQQKKNDATAMFGKTEAYLFSNPAFYC